MIGLKKILEDYYENLRDGFLLIADVFPGGIEYLKKRYEVTKEGVYPKDVEELITIGAKAFSRFSNRGKEIGKKESLYEKIMYVVPFGVGGAGGAVVSPVAWPTCAIINAYNHRKQKRT